MAKLSQAVLERFRAWGSVGGKTAASNMTPKQRQLRARKAVATRERKRKKNVAGKPK